MKIKMPSWLIFCSSDGHEAEVQAAPEETLLKQKCDFLCSYWISGNTFIYSFTVNGYKLYSMFPNINVICSSFLYTKY